MAAWLAKFNSRKYHGSNKSIQRPEPHRALFRESQRWDSGVRVLPNRRWPHLAGKTVPAGKHSNEHRTNLRRPRRAFSLTPCMSRRQRYERIFHSRRRRNCARPGIHRRLACAGSLAVRITVRSPAYWRSYARHIDCKIGDAWMLFAKDRREYDDFLRGKRDAENELEQMQKNFVPNSIEFRSDLQSEINRSTCL